jgi:hypothetical protein
MHIKKKCNVDRRGDIYVVNGMTFNHPIEWFDVDQLDVERKILYALSLNEKDLESIYDNKYDFTVDNFKPRIENVIVNNLCEPSYGPSLSKKYELYLDEYRHAELSDENINYKSINMIDIQIDECMVCDNIYSYVLVMRTKKELKKSSVNIKINNNVVLPHMILTNGDVSFITFFHEEYKGHYISAHKNLFKLSTNTELLVSSLQFIKIPRKNEKKYVLYVGNFMHTHSTETHISSDLKKIGYNVINLQENNCDSHTFSKIISYFKNVMLLDILMLLYTRTWGYLTREQLSDLRQMRIKSVSYHLDLYYPLKRKNSVKDDAFWLTDYVFITDCDPDAMMYYKKINNNIFPLYAGIHSSDCVMYPVTNYEHDIIFVGSGSIKGDYHGEWPYRIKLLKFLYSYKNFAKFGPPDITVRNSELNKLYSKTKIVIGDTICVNFTYQRYWSDRIYETLGRGGFLIFPYIKGLEEEFVDKKHLVFYEYGNFDQLRKLIEYYLKNDEERETIRKCGFEFVKNNYTYKHRMLSLISKI